MRVLVVEDDTQLNIAISRYFEKNNFEVTSLKDGLEAIDYIDKATYEKVTPFDLYVVDINLPNINGLDIVKHIRSTDIKTPIIIITASLEIQNLTTAYENGCNEYIKKPFHLKELEIRLKRLINLEQSSKMIRFEDEFYYDRDKTQFVFKNQPIELRYKEKRFCELLIKNINQVVPNSVIYDYVWDDKDNDSYPLRQLVNSIRRKLPFEIIQTKVKEGYFISSLKKSF